MRIVTTNGTRAFSFIPRDLQTASKDYEVTLTNEETKVDEVIDITYTLSDFNDNIGQVIVPVTSTYNEGEYFRIKVVSDSDVVYRGKLFVTDQNPQNYNINE